MTRADIGLCHRTGHAHPGCDRRFDSSAWKTGIIVSALLLSLLAACGEGAGESGGDEEDGTSGIEDLDMVALFGSGSGTGNPDHWVLSFAPLASPVGDVQWRAATLRVGSISLVTPTPAEAAVSPRLDEENPAYNPAPDTVEHAAEEAANGTVCPAHGKWFPLGRERLIPLIGGNPQGFRLRLPSNVNLCGLHLYPSFGDEGDAGAMFRASGMWRGVQPILIELPVANRLRLLFERNPLQARAKTGEARAILAFDLDRLLDGIDETLMKPDAEGIIRLGLTGDLRTRRLLVYNLLHYLKIVLDADATGKVSAADLAQNLGYVDEEELSSSASTL